MKFPENVDNGPKNRRFHFGYVLHSGGILTFELPDLGEGTLIINLISKEPTMLSNCEHLRVCFTVRFIFTARFQKQT